MKIKHIIPIILLAIACGKKKETSPGTELVSKNKELEKARKERQEIENKIAALEKEIEKIAPNTIRSNITLVTTVTAKKKPFEHRITVRSSAKSRKNIQVSAQVTGIVKHIYVEEGQLVKKGQLLLSFDANVLQNMITEQKTALKLAVAIYKKRENLWSKGIGTEIQYLEAKNNKELLERKLLTTKSQLDQNRIKAPFTGTIEEVQIKEGELAVPGSQLVKITNPQAMYLQADVSERYINQIQVGDQVNAFFPSQDQTYKTGIKAVGQVVNDQNRTFEIEVKTPNTSFKIIPNQVVILQLRDYYNPQAWVVPSRIIQRDNSGYFIFCTQTQQGKTKAVKKTIEIGESYDSNTEVIEGISENDQIVYYGFHELADGNEVKVTTDEKQTTQ